MYLIAQTKNVLKEMILGLSQNIKNIFFTPWIYVIIIVHTILFFPVIFIMNDANISFISSIDVDHASMLNSMVTMLKIDHLYNQMVSFHSSIYGWTYFFFAFLFLAPLKFITWLYGLNTFLVVFVGLKTIHFLYGLLAILTFFFLSKKFLPNAYAFLAALFLMFSSALSTVLYTFHPETIGLCFFNLAMLYLYDFCTSNNSNKKELVTQYFIILMFLTLTTLSKPTFLFITAPFCFALLTIYLNKNHLTSKTFMTNKVFLKIVLSSMLFSIIIFFIINPFFFIHLKYAIQRQIWNTQQITQATNKLIMWRGLIKSWVRLFLSDPFIIFSLCSTFVIVIFSYSQLKPNNPNKKLIIFLQISVMAFILITMISMRLFISIRYLTPIISILILNSMIVIYRVVTIFKLHKWVQYALALIILFCMSIQATIKSKIIELHDFYSYKDKLQYKVYLYLKNNIPNGSSITHDHLIAIPDGKNIKDYHYWQHSFETIENAKSDYIIFDSLYKLNNDYVEQTKHLMLIINNQHYKKIATIDSPTQNVEIWKANESL